MGSRPVDDLIVTPPSKDSLGSKEEMQSILEDDIAKVQAKAQAKVQAGIAQPAWEDEITACLAAANVKPEAREKLIDAGVEDMETLALLGKAGRFHRVRRQGSRSAMRPGWMRGCGPGLVKGPRLEHTGLTRAAHAGVGCACACRACS